MMNDFLLHDLLPPGMTEALKHVATHAAPEVAVGIGFGAPEETGPRLADDGPRMFEDPKLECLPAGYVMRWQPDPRVIFVSAPTPPTVLVGSPWLHEGVTLELDSSRERFVLLFRRDSEDVVLDIDEGEIREHRKTRAGTSKLDDLPPPASVPQLTLLRPDLDALGDSGLPSWLLARAREQVGTGEDGPAVAVGLIVRLGHPETAVAKAAELERLRAGLPPSRTAWALAWLQEIPPTHLDALEARARIGAVRLLAALDGLNDLLARTPAAGRALAEDVLLSRDRAESVARVLALVRRDKPLRVVLVSLDRRGAALGTALGEGLTGSHELDGDWLDAVAWQEPDAWWGALASPL